MTKSAYQSTRGVDAILWMISAKEHFTTGEEMIIENIKNNKFDTAANVAIDIRTHNGAEIAEAKVVGERLRKAVEETSITINQDTIDEKQINVTISLGIAEFDKQETGEALFERADKALYEAKKNGRNQVQTA